MAGKRGKSKGGAQGKGAGKKRSASLKDARRVGAAIRQGGRDIKRGVIQVGGPRSGPIASPKKPSFEAGGRTHALTFRRVKDRQSLWRCTCGANLTVPHRAREDAGEREALNNHCGEVLGKTLQEISTERARAARKAPQADRPRRPLGGRPKAAVERKEGNAEASSRPDPTSTRRSKVRRPNATPFSWQKQDPGPAAQPVPVRLCANCDVNEVNCRC